MHHIIIALLLFLSCSARAQLFADYNFKFKTYTTNDGLVHNSVKKCQADSKGFLWIITENGLSRFDGYQFKNFQHSSTDSNSLPSNDLSDIVIDKQDRVWLAYHLGLCYYDQKKQHFTLVYANKQQIPAEQLAYDGGGNFLFIVTANGLLKYDASRSELRSTVANKMFPNNITCAMIDNNRNIWIGIERNGYYKYNIAADTIHYYTDCNWANNFFQDAAGTMYICSRSGSFIKMDADGKFNKDFTYRLPTDTLTGDNYSYQACTESNALTGKDILWVATLNGGVALFSKEQKKFIRWFRYQPELLNGLKTDFNWYIYTPPDGTVWICTWHGLSRINKQSQQFSSAELPELNSNLYNCITGIMNDPHDSNKVWMSVNGSGLAEYSRKKQQLVKWNFHYKDNNNPGDLYLKKWCVYLKKDSNNTIWASSYGGFAKIKNGQVSFKLMPDEGNKYAFSPGTYQDKKDNLWLMGFLLQRLNPYTEKYESWHLPEHNKNEPDCYAYAIAEATNGNIFAGTNNGLFEFEINHAVFTAIDFWKSLPDSTTWKDIRALETIGNKLYIGTVHGVVEMDIYTHQCTLISQKEQIVRTDVGSLHKDALGKLWIYAGNGVFRYDPASHEMLKFTSADGIYNTSNDPAYFFEYENDLFIGYRAAYTRFDPALVNSNGNKPVPYITEIKVTGSYLPINTDEYNNKTLSLAYTQSNITFDFTAIEYNDPDKISFSYMLEGFDNDWITAGNKRSISYTNIPGGEFVFKVKAYNSSGLASEKIATFKIKIIPPFWKTWWFYMMILATVSVISILISRWMQKRNQELNKMNEQVARVELASLRSQMNPHFIFNSLNSIHKYIWENKQDDASEYLTKFSKLVRMILENSKEKEIPLSKELEGLQLYIELEHRRCNNKFDYSITVDPSFNTSNVLIPAMIIQPYVENAIWHGLVQKEGHGQLTISITKGIKQLTCIIEDDGIGRKKAAAIKEQKQDVHKSMGLDITAERLNLLSKESGVISSVQIIDIDDGINTRTKVILQLPLNMMY